MSFFLFFFFYNTQRDSKIVKLWLCVYGCVCTCVRVIKRRIQLVKSLQCLFGGNTLEVKVLLDEFKKGMHDGERGSGTKFFSLPLPLSWSWGASGGNESLTRPNKSVNGDGLLPSTRVIVYRSQIFFFSKSKKCFLQRKNKKCVVAKKKSIIVNYQYKHHNIIIFFSISLMSLSFLFREISSLLTPTTPLHHNHHI